MVQTTQIRVCCVPPIAQPGHAKHRVGPTDRSSGAWTQTTNIRSPGEVGITETKSAHGHERTPPARRRGSIIRSIYPKGTIAGTANLAATRTPRTHAQKTTHRETALHTRLGLVAPRRARGPPRCGQRSRDELPPNRCLGRNTHGSAVEPRKRAVTSEIKMCELAYAIKKYTTEAVPKHYY